MKKKKSLGQHFLTDSNILFDIADAIKQIDCDNILEIGPGEGALTNLLVQQNRNLYLLEKDDRLPEILEKKFPQLTNKIIHQDALAADWAAHFNNNAFIVVGNFPYNISSQLMFKMLEYNGQAKYMVGMFQKEVAQRLAAQPSTKQYGVISILIQLFYNAQYLFDVPAHCFDPPPKVVSGVIKLESTDQWQGQFDYKQIRLVVKLAFSQRRKKLSNALSTLNIDWKNLPADLPNKRAEHLSIKDYINLCKHVEF